MSKDSNRDFKELAKEYARQSYLVSEENHPVEDEEKALTDLVEYLHQELQKAREEERERILTIAETCNIDVNRLLEAINQSEPEDITHTKEWQEAIDKIGTKNKPELDQDNSNN